MCVNMIRSVSDEKGIRLSWIRLSVSWCSSGRCPEIILLGYWLQKTVWYRTHSKFCNTSCKLAVWWKMNTILPKKLCSPCSKYSTSTYLYKRRPFAPTDGSRISYSFWRPRGIDEDDRYPPSTDQDANVAIGCHQPCRRSTFRGPHFVVFNPTAWNSVSGLW